MRTDAPAYVQVELSTSPEFTSTIWSEGVHTENDSDYFGKVVAVELQSSTEYYYRAIIDESPVADGIERRFSTFPIPGTATTFSFHTGSGQQNGPDPNSGFGTLFPVMAADEPDFVIHQGDWCYPDTTDEESGNPGNYFSLDYDNVAASYHARYDSAFPMIELLRVAPIAYTYDDHDMIDNNSDGSFPWDGIENSILGYQNMFPGYDLPNPELGIWHKFTYGNTDVFMVDNRSQRTPNIANFDILPNQYVEFNPPEEHTFLGTDQMNWLLEELSSSEATWKFISTGTPFNPSWRIAIELAVFTQSIYDSIEVPGEGYITPGEIAVELADKWAGFPNDILQLIEHISENEIKNVIFLSGDTHTSGIDDGQSSIFPELMAGGLDRTNGELLSLFSEFGIDIWNSGGHTPDLAPEEFGNAYGRVTVFGEDSVVLQAVAEDESVLGSLTVKDGFYPRSVGSVLAPFATVDFDTVDPGVIGENGFLMVSTSVDTLVLDSIHVVGAPTIFLDPSLGDAPYKIPPGEKLLIGFGFFSISPGQVSEATIYVWTNDPLMPVYEIPARAVCTPVSVIAAEGNIVYEFALHQNYPNPFNPTTNIKFTIPQTENVKIEVFNVVGQKIQTLLDKKMVAGHHEIEFTANNLASGIYFYTIESGLHRQVRKMILLK
jgi:alkaline phosphatase D